MGHSLIPSNTLIGILQGRISHSRCTAVPWVPSSPTLFLVARSDGTVIAHGRDREDGPFRPQEPTQSSTAASSSMNGSGSSSSSSHGEWNPLDSIFASLPSWHPVSFANSAGKPDRSAKNPVSHWRVSTRTIAGKVPTRVFHERTLTSRFCVLAGCETLQSFRLVNGYASYFGAPTAVAWSPDGRFILIGFV